MSGMKMGGGQAGQAGGGGAMPGSGMNMPGMSGMGMGGSMMDMTSTVDLLAPMSGEGSGTSWLPASSPMYGKAIMYGRNMLMLHGALTPRYTYVPTPRGDSKVTAPNWFMAMYSHPLGTTDQLGLRLMMSLDPITVGGAGYPLLFQTGESWHGVALHDHQHPHDLFSELSATYSRRFGPHSAYLYVGYPGEPALGPPTFMHRLIAYDLPDAPLSHHWMDSAHITFGVATVGVDIARRVKLESSVFTGREPNENRYNFDPARFDSQSGRVTWNPDANDSFQISYGFLKSPEGLNLTANQHRVTASYLYNLPLGADANVTTTLAFGQNNTGAEGKTNAYLAEADYQRERNAFFARLENVQKSGHELVLPAPYETGKYNVGAYTFGYLRDLTHGTGIDTGVGGSITVNGKPSGLDPIYGRATPVGFQIMLRFRPSRMSMAGGMAGMGGMHGKQTLRGGSPGM